MDELKFNQVKLSDGRVVEMREKIGNDEMIVAGHLGKLYTMDGAGFTIMQSCLMARTIVSIGDVSVDPKELRDYAAYRDFLGNFTGKDMNKISALFKKMNTEEDETEEGNA